MDKSNRFRLTMTLRMKTAFGDERSVWEAAQQIEHMHGFIHGQADVPGKGTMTYSARDSQLLQ